MADFDKDGDLDLYVTNMDGDLDLALTNGAAAAMHFLLRNELPAALARRSLQVAVVDGYRRIDGRRRRRPDSPGRPVDTPER